MLLQPVCSASPSTTTSSPSAKNYSPALQIKTSPPRPGDSLPNFRLHIVMKTPRDLSDEIKSRRTISRETFKLPRSEARRRAKQMFVEFPTSSYMTSVESCREFSGGRVLQMTITRLDYPINEVEDK